MNFNGLNLIAVQCNKKRCQYFNILYKFQIVLLRKPKLSRHIKLNPTNIALLLQETTQKYQKLTDY